MAVTNEQIIFTQSQNLLKEGKLKATGRVLVMEDAEGNKMEFPEAEPIHTFAVWKSIGFSVKKGEKAVAQFPIWNYSNRKKSADGEQEPREKGGYCYMKKASFFSLSQVDRIAVTQ